MSFQPRLSDYESKLPASRSKYNFITVLFLLTCAFLLSCNGESIGNYVDSSYRYATKPVIEKTKEQAIEKPKDYITNVPTLIGPIPDDAFMIEPVLGQFRYCYKNDTSLYLTLKDVGELIRLNGGAELDSNVIIRINTNSMRSKPFADIIDTLRANGIVHYYFWTDGVDRYPTWDRLIRAK